MRRGRPSQERAARKQALHRLAAAPERERARGPGLSEQLVFYQPLLPVRSSVRGPAQTLGHQCIAWGHCKQLR